MNAEWIQCQHTSSLLLVFNGWGMDRHPLACLQPEIDMDLLLLHDYREPDITPDVLAQLQQYQSIAVIAWSMGVWAYTHCRWLPQERITHAIAVNGTPFPVHSEYGIDPALYQATIDHFSEQGRNKFYKRMCASGRIMRYFQLHSPQRSLEDQKEELLAIRHAALSQENATNSINYALISQRDRIIPTAHQIAYWQQHGAYICLDAPHFPFLQWTRWKELLNYGTDY